MSEEMISQLLGSFLGGNYSSISGLSSLKCGILSNRMVSDEETIQYIAENHIDTSAPLLDRERKASRS